MRTKKGDPNANPSSAKAQMSKLLREHVRLCFKQTEEFQSLIDVAGKINGNTPDNVAKALSKSVRVQFFEPNQFKVGQLFVMIKERDLVDGIILSLDQTTYATAKRRLDSSNDKLYWLREIINLDDSLMADILFDYKKGEVRRWSWFTMGTKASKCTFLKGILSEAFNNFAHDIESLVNEKK